MSDIKEDKCLWEDADTFYSLTFKLVLDTPFVLSLNNENPPLIRAEPNGDVFIRGTLVDNDHEIYEEFKNFFKGLKTYVEEFKKITS